MKCVVTGAAGFIGSHLCEALLRAGHEVIGLDALGRDSPEIVGQRNLLALLSFPHCRFFRLDLERDRIDDLLGQAEVIFHLAARSATGHSWARANACWATNVQATQKLLEAARRSAGQLRRFVFASASSVYGPCASGDETMPTKPISPYGISKLAAESLCLGYALTYGLPVLALRYYSVYGPRQRPDMGCHRFIQALLDGRPLTIYGDGHQVRGLTYVDDCVRATIAAVEAPAGEAYNVGGAEAASVWDVLRKLEALAGRRVKVRHEPARPGDSPHAVADTSRFRRLAGWQPRTSLDDGLALQWAWQARPV